jgi:hypothetical protein
VISQAAKFDPSLRLAELNALFRSRGRSVGAGMAAAIRDRFIPAALHATFDEQLRHASATGYDEIRAIHRVLQTFDSWGTTADLPVYTQGGSGRMSLAEQFTQTDALKTPTAALLQQAGATLSPTLATPEQRIGIMSNIIYNTAFKQVQLDAELRDRLLPEYARAQFTVDYTYALNSLKATPYQAAELALRKFDRRDFLGQHHLSPEFQKANNNIARLRPAEHRLMKDAAASGMTRGEIADGMAQYDRGFHKLTSREWLSHMFSRVIELRAKFNLATDPELG